MNILITNDDGIEAPGIIALAKAFSKMGKVFVCAPDSQRSCTSHSMTIKGKVQVEKVDFIDNIEAYKCYGTAVDCIRFAVRVLMKEKPDLVVTGINNDPNLGSDIIYSATISCAREGFLQGIPSLATALASHYYEFDKVCEYSLEIAEKLLKDPHNKEYFLSLNLPATQNPKGLIVCDEYGYRDYDESYRLEKIEGKEYITLNETYTHDRFDTNNLKIDMNAFREGYATLTAFHVNQIDKKQTDYLNDYYLNKKKD